VKKIWILALLGSTLCGAEPASVRTAQITEFEIIKQNIEAYHPSHWSEFEKVSAQTLRQDALILKSDRTPVDVILRRTQALIDHLNNSSEQPVLDKLKKQNRSGLSEEEQTSLFLKIATVRRRVAFSNPLLDFDSLLFLKHDRMARGESHMVDQYLGINQRRGGGVYRLENIFSKAPRVTDLLTGSPVQSGRLKGAELGFESGSFISLDLDYDAQELLFAFTENQWKGWENEANWTNQPWTQEEAAGQGHTRHYCWKPESSFHIFRADADGSNLHQLTDGQWDDFDPCFLPNDRIVFVSARAGGNQRCGKRFLPTYTLFGMMPDGSDIQQFSWHDTNEWHPSVNHDGMLVYTRWDYVDRDSDIAHHLWLCYPDGRDPRSMHGNYPDSRSLRPWMEMSIRAVPESHKYTAVATPHHGEAYGSLILIDQSIPDDRVMSQVKRITPLSGFPESEVAPGSPAISKKDQKSPMKGQADWNYGSPWPLSEDLTLCVYAPRGAKKKKGEKYGIYLVDSLGNRELIYSDPKISCLDPIPLKARTRPPQIPVQTTQMKADREPGADLSMGTVSVMNVYEGEFPIPDGVKIKELRIVNVFPKSTHEILNPRIGYADESLTRGVLGTVPVEEDGSVFFECPTGAGLYFQLLDDRGMMVQNMRSDTYLHPGENLSCIGCHENKHQAPKITGTPMALKRAPSTIQPEAPGSYPLTFPRLVQPVLEKYPEFFAALYPDQSLSGTEFGEWGWSKAMHTLSKDAWGRHGGNGALERLNDGRSYSLPMKEGARVSRLWKKLEAADAREKLSPEDLRRITLWLDCNSNFYGAYKQVDKQASGGVILPEEGLPKWSDPAQLVH
jgi:hypothetical protein